MADEPLRKVEPGAPLRIPASTYNAFVDAARHASGVHLGGAPIRRLRSAGIISVRNNSGAARGACDVLGISEPLISPDANESEFVHAPALIGVLPTEADHSGRFCILVEPIAAGEIGLAMVSGVCAARVNVLDADHEYADVLNEDASKLQSAATGSAQILWRESGTGEKWALARVGNPGGITSVLLLGRPAQAFTEGAQVSLNPCDAHGTPTGEDAVDVYVRPNGESYTMLPQTELPDTAIVPYQKAADDKYYVIGSPRTIMIDIQVNVEAKQLQIKRRDEWGTFHGTDSEWINIHGAVQCELPV